MGTTIEAVKLVLTSLLFTEPWIRDPNVTKMPWNANVETSTLARASPDGSANEEKPLTIGLYWSNGVVTPQPPVSRDMKIVHDVLENLGHKVNRLDLSFYTEATDRYWCRLSIGNLRHRVLRKEST